MSMTSSRGGSTMDRMSTVSSVSANLGKAFLNSAAKSGMESNSKKKSAALLSAGRRSSRALCALRENRAMVQGPEAVE